MSPGRSRLVLLALFALSCGDESQERFRDPSAPLEARVQDLLGRLTLPEKIDQMHGVGIETIEGTYHTPDNTRLGIPGFGMVDGPRGVAVYAGGATAFPVGAARGATFDPDLEAQVGAAIAKEALARGANVILAPVLNVLRHPAWGRAQETYGEDPQHLGVMGAAFIRGAQQYVIASAKHFAANSIENTRFQVDVHMDERTLREVYLPQFKKAVEAGVGSVMSAYNQLNGHYCAENRHLLGDILQSEWRFDGFVESDWILGTRSTVPSALAGLDIEMPWAMFYGGRLLAAVRAGQVPEATIDEAVGRILRAKFRFGIYDRMRVADPAAVESPEHTALALEVERKAIVLLENRNAALPLSRSGLRTIAVVGALADTANLGDRGSSSVAPSYVVTPLGGIASRAGPLRVLPVRSDTPTANDLAQIAAADAAIVVAGLTANDEGELAPPVGDRATLELSGVQQALIHEVASRNSRTIVVLEGGSAITMEGWADQVQAILMAWYPGLEGGNAIAEVLFGDTNPSGKLPVTFPHSAAELPAFVNNRDQVEYDYYHGYRFVDRMGLRPRYPFGFGSSYTSFALANLVLAESLIRPDGRLRASVDVTNTGAVAGDEVVQLYVAYPGSQVDRPVRTLAAFQRVSLAPGQTRTVPLEVAAADLGFFDAATGAWVVEPIAYTVEVGSSSRDLPLQASFTVAPAR